MLLPLRKASIGSTYNSGEDIATSQSSSEVDERPNWGMLASPLSTQKRETQVQPRSGFITPTENSESRSSHVPTSTGRPVAMYSPKNKSSRDSNVLQESYSQKKSILTEHREIRDVLELRADRAAQGEKAALSRLSEAENHTTLLLEV